MQTVLEVQKLKPLGTKVLVKRAPDAVERKGLVIPEAYRLNKEGHVFAGTAIAVGDRTKSARYGRKVGWFEPGDTIWFWHPWNWNDHEVVLKDAATGDQYLTIDESDVKAYEPAEEVAA